MRSRGGPELRWCRRDVRGWRRRPRFGRTRCVGRLMRGRGGPGLRRCRRDVRGWRRRPRFGRVRCDGRESVAGGRLIRGRGDPGMRRCRRDVRGWRRRPRFGRVRCGGRESVGSGRLMRDRGGPGLRRGRRSGCGRRWRQQLGRVRCAGRLGACLGRLMRSRGDPGFPRGSRSGGGRQWRRHRARDRSRCLRRGRIAKPSGAGDRRARSLTGTRHRRRTARRRNRAGDGPGRRRRRAAIRASRRGRARRLQRGARRHTVGIPALRGSGCGGMLARRRGGNLRRSHGRARRVGPRRLCAAGGTVGGRSPAIRGRRTGVESTTRIGRSNRSRRISARATAGEQRLSPARRCCDVRCAVCRNTRSARSSRLSTACRLRIPGPGGRWPARCLYGPGVRGRGRSCIQDRGRHDGAPGRRRYGGRTLRLGNRSRFPRHRRHDGARSRNRCGARLARSDVGPVSSAARRRDRPGRRRNGLRRGRPGRRRSGLRRSRRDDGLHHASPAFARRILRRRPRMPRTTRGPGCGRIIWARSLVE